MTTPEATGPTPAASSDGVREALVELLEALDLIRDTGAELDYDDPEEPIAKARAALAGQPAQPTDAEAALDDAVRRVYAKYGPDMRAFMRDAKAALEKQPSEPTQPQTCWCGGPLLDGVCHRTHVKDDNTQSHPSRRVVRVYVDRDTDGREYVMGEMECGQIIIIASLRQSGCVECTDKLFAVTLPSHKEPAK